jgi:hypothetical protein
MDALINLYPKLSSQGYVIIDDYHAVPACKAAVNDYCCKSGIKPEMIEIDGVGVYWRKSAVVECDGEIIRLDKTVASPDAQIARLNQAMAELSSDILARLNQALAERDGQVSMLNQTVVERDGKIASLIQSLAERDEQIAALLSSNSWRMTKPLRAVGSFLRETKVPGRNRKGSQ